MSGNKKETTGGKETKARRQKEDGNQLKCLITKWWRKYSTFNKEQIIENFHREKWFRYLKPNQIHYWIVSRKM